MATWAEDEFEGASLGDKRLNLRLIKLATQFAEQPTASIPGACGGIAETKAAYRFFDQANADRVVGRRTGHRHGLDAVVAPQELDPAPGRHGIVRRQDEAQRGMYLLRPML